MENREEIALHILIGKDKYGSYVFLDDAFRYKDGGLQGLCGTSMEFHTEEEFEERKEDMINDGYLKDLWKDAVNNNSTEESLEDYSADVLFDNPDFVYDTSYRCSWRIDDALEIIDKHEFEQTGIHVTSEFSDCVGGGRCFNKDMLSEDYWEWVEEENFKKFKELYAEYEKPNDDRNTIDKAKKRLKSLYAVGLFSTDFAKMKWESFEGENGAVNAENFLLTYSETECDRNLFDKLEQEGQK